MQRLADGLTAEKIDGLLAKAQRRGALTVDVPLVQAPWATDEEEPHPPVDAYPRQSHRDSHGHAASTRRADMSILRSHRVPGPAAYLLRRHQTRRLG